MEDKKISEQESLALISQMIQNTRRRIEIGDGNMLLYSGIWCLLVGLVVYAAVALTGSGFWQFLWFLVPAGFLLPRRKGTKNAKTFIDRASETIWRSVFAILFVMLLTVSLHQLFGLQPGMKMLHWMVFYFFPFFVVGFAILAQGVLIQERSMILGALVSFALGTYALCVSLDGAALDFHLGMILMLLDFAALLFIPGIAIRAKAKKQR